MTLRTIRQNLAFAVAWNVIALVLAVLGSVGPVGGALIHNIGSVAVVANAARLVGRQERGHYLILPTAIRELQRGASRRGARYR